MKKNKFLDFINRYYVDSNVESVRVVIDKKTMTTEFSQPAVVGKVQIKDVDLPDAEFGIQNTSVFQRIVSAFKDDVKISIISSKDKVSGLTFDDGTHRSYISTGELKFIPVTASLRFEPDYESTIELNKDLIDLFIKMIPLVDTKLFRFEDAIDHYEVAFGESGNGNYTSVSFKLPETLSLNISPSMSFNSQVLMNILRANKEFKKGVMKISNKGLVNIAFENSDMNSQYFIPETIT